VNVIDNESVFVVETWHEGPDGEVSAPLDYYCRTLEAAAALATNLAATTGLRVAVTEHPFGPDGIATDPIAHKLPSRAV
jgi:hypothetical protein